MIKIILLSLLSLLIVLRTSEKYLPRDIKFIINDLKNKEREGS
jgi:hypothetical protein